MTPPSPSLSARISTLTYLIETMSVTRPEHQRDDAVDVALRSAGPRRRRSRTRSAARTAGWCRCRRRRRRARPAPAPAPAAWRSWPPGSAGSATGAEGAGEVVELLMDGLPWTDAPAADHRGADPPRRPLRVPCHKTARQAAPSTPPGSGHAVPARIRLDLLPGGEVARGRRPVTPQRCPPAPQLPDDGGLAAAERQRALCRSAARAAEAVSPQVVLNVACELAWACAVNRTGGVARAENS